MIKVIYHHPCSDGFCAAYLFWKKYPEAEFIPMNYGMELDISSFAAEDDVFIVDFSFKRNILLKLAARVAAVTVLDHHKTAQEELCPDTIETGHLLEPWPKNCDIFFDMERSGAMMAWDYLYTDEEPTDIVKYVQDRDLWQWKLEYSKTINAHIQSLPFDFEVWDILNNIPLYEMIQSGKAILRKIDQQVELVVSRSKEYMLGNVRVWAVNETANFSEVAGTLAEKTGVGVAWFWDDGYKYSLRGTDVSAIAKEYGGGGHAAAAGFSSENFVLVKYEKPTLGRVYKLDTKYVYIWGHDVNVRPTFSNPNVPNGDFYIGYECDEKGNKINDDKLYIKETELL